MQHLEVTSRFRPQETIHLVSTVCMKGEILTVCVCISGQLTVLVHRHFGKPYIEKLFQTFFFFFLLNAKRDYLLVLIQPKCMIFKAKKKITLKVAHMTCAFYYKSVFEEHTKIKPFQHFHLLH